ncbi:MAG: membrane protein insertion efficiency factor YidD [Spirochaetes bacterium]|nr:membrane protein insertion efficiency factor YidD [Spirochaetota bacterium]
MSDSKRKRLFAQLFRRIIIVFIRIYQLVLSPLFPPSCIYTPTCSQYAIDAVRKHGILKGGFMAARRILRCTPFHTGGYDPVR